MTYFFAGWFFGAFGVEGGLYYGVAEASAV